jgi:hypothetical protein
MNRKSTNNNQKSNNNNSRFSFVSNELQKEKVTNEKVKDKVTNEKVNEKENMFKQRETNSRFNLDRLMEDPAPTYTPAYVPNPPPPNPMRNYSFIAASKPQQSVAPPKQQINIQQSDFPTLSSSQNLKPAAEPAKINFKNAITTTNPEVIEETKFVPKPGMAYIITNKAGKSKLIYGPKTIEEKRKEYLDNNMNYQMYLAISRMEIRWAEEKRRYNSIHGENAFQTKYGITSYNNSHDDYDDDDDDTDTDTNDDSDYETE